MSLRTTALACALFLAAGCASHPERPDTGTSGAPASAATSAHLFDGCTLRDVEAAGFLLKCGSVVASLRIAQGIAPARLVAAQVKGMQQSGAAHVRASNGTATVGGVERPAKIVKVYAKPTDASPMWTGKVVGLGDVGHGSRVLSCGAANATDSARCPAILAWLATHDAPPPGVPAAGEVDKAADAWPPKGAMEKLAGCTKVDAPTGILHLKCGTTEIALGRIGAKPNDQAANDRLLVMMAKHQLVALRKKVTPDANLDYVDCRLGGQKASCSRIRAKTKGGQVEMVMAVGTLFNGAAVMQCMRVVTSPALPKECAAFIDLGDVRPEPTPGPAPAGALPAGP